jgi:RNA polymerase sigma-70 factor (ECF subfamily)
MKQPAAPRVSDDVRTDRQRVTALVSSNQSTVVVTAGHLAERCRAGDDEAFEQLYREQSPRVFALARRMSGSPDVAEDLVQEIFLLVHRKLPGFKGESAIGTWVYRLALNHCIDFVRGRQARAARLTDPLDAEQAAEPPAPRESLVARIDLGRAIEQLPDGCREAFVLHDVEGLEHKEIARALGIAEGTSKSQVFKARMKLRHILTGAQERCR